MFLGNRLSSKGSKGRVLGLFAIGSSLIAPLPASAYLLMNWGARYDAKAPVVLHYVSGSCASLGIQDSDMNHYLDETIKNYWGSVSSATLTLLRGAPVDSPASGERPSNTIEVSCSSSPEYFSHNHLGGVIRGIGWQACRSASDCYGVAIMNGNPKDVPPVGRAWSWQFVGALAHEIGHALGLDHTDETGLMTDASTGVSGDMRKLSEDDIHGLNALFPQESSPKLATVLARSARGGASLGEFADLVADLFLTSESTRRFANIETRCRFHINRILGKPALRTYFGENLFKMNKGKIGGFLYDFCVNTPELPSDRDRIADRLLSGLEWYGLRNFLSP